MEAGSLDVQDSAIPFFLKVASATHTIGLLCALGVLISFKLVQLSIVCRMRSYWEEHNYPVKDHAEKYLAS